jgi:hypothetical protein
VKGIPLLSPPCPSMRKKTRSYALATVLSFLRAAVRAR